MRRSATEVRRRLAERAAAALAESPAVSAVLLGGSAGRGEADAYSDIELGVFWTAAPTDADRSAAIERAGGDLHRLYPYDPAERCWFDEWTLGRRDRTSGTGVWVETVHMTGAEAEAAVSDVVKRCDPDLAKHVLLAALVDGVPLAGPAILDEWRRRALSYPDGLAVAVVEQHAQIDHFWRFPMFAERRNPLQAAKATADVHERVLHALLAINRIYWPGFKFLESLVEKLAVAPDDLAARIRRAYGTDPLTAQRRLEALVEETYDLVEQHVPGANVDRLRTIFRYRRPLWGDEMLDLADTPVDAVRT